MRPQDFIDKRLSYALVGATANQAKYGYTVLMDLHGAGFTIVGVNPKHADIEGVPVHPSLASLPQKPDVVIFVVPPDVGARVLNEVAALGIRKAWFQPGAESETIRSRAKELGIEVVADGSCIMVARRSLGL